MSKALCTEIKRAVATRDRADAAVTAMLRHAQADGESNFSAAARAAGLTRDGAYKRINRYDPSKENA